MAIRYRLNINYKLTTEDIPVLPYELQVDFETIFKPLLENDPQKCDGLSCHFLRGRLRGCKALEIKWEGDSNAYRLIYRICDRPAPRYVEVISFARHNLAYECAQHRRGKK